MHSTNTKGVKSFSCEFFPPRTEKGTENLLKAHESIRQLMDPAFFSVTFGAGGTTRDRTLDAVRQLIGTGSNIAPHISCIGSSKATLSEILDEYTQCGVNRLVVLRGDIPETGNPDNELQHASDLVSFIRSTTGDRFTIEVAAYPEYHPESESPQSDFRHFKTKVDAGADGAITQYFYNIDAYLNFIDNCEKHGIDIPVVPGIMPITNCEGLVKFSDRCGAEIPRWIRKQLEAYADDSESLKQFGEDVVTDLCRRLLENDVPGLHFYTLNQASATNAIWNNLSL
jgi:methylenetetrahydrofolate reductase (NADPH)